MDSKHFLKAAALGICTALAVFAGSRLLQHAQQAHATLPLCGLTGFQAAPSSVAANTATEVSFSWIQQGAQYINTQQIHQEGRQTPVWEWRRPANSQEAAPSRARVTVTISSPTVFRLTASGNCEDNGEGQRTVTIQTSGGRTVRIPVTLRVLPRSGGSISGIKFDDENGNGRKDEGERGLAGWTITLTPGGGGTPQTDTTDADGSYSFTGLAAGTYTVSETAQSGWRQTAPAAPGTHSVTLTAGQRVTGKDFGNRNIELDVGACLEVRPPNHRISASEPRKSFNVRNTAGTARLTVTSCTSSQTWLRINDCPTTGEIGPPRTFTVELADPNSPPDVGSVANVKVTAAAAEGSRMSQRQECRERTVDVTYTAGVDGGKLEVVRVGDDGQPLGGNPPIAVGSTAKFKANFCADYNAAATQCRQSWENVTEHTANKWRSRDPSIASQTNTTGTFEGKSPGDTEISATYTVGGSQETSALPQWLARFMPSVRATAAKTYTASAPLSVFDPNRDFSLEGPGNCPVANPGESTSYSIRVTPRGTFEDNVSMTLSGLEGWTHTFNPNPVITKGAPRNQPISTTLEINPPVGGAASNVYNFTISGTGGNPPLTRGPILLCRKVPKLEVQPVDPPSGNTTCGGNASFRALYDPDGPGTDMPFDVTQQTETTWRVISGEDIAEVTTTPGLFRGKNKTGTATVQAVYRGLTANASMNVSCGSGFQLDVQPTNPQNVEQQKSASYTATITPQGGYDKDVVLTVEGLPSSIDYSFIFRDQSGRAYTVKKGEYGNPISLVLNVRDTRAGNYQFKVVGTGEDRTRHEQTRDIEVTCPASGCVDTKELKVTVVGNGKVHIPAGRGSAYYCMSGATCSQYYNKDTPVDISAVSLDRSTRFKGWTGDCQRVTGNDCRVFMDAHKQVTATFEDIPPGHGALMVEVIGDGVVREVSGGGINCSPGASVGCYNLYNLSSGGPITVTLTAEPRTGSIFNKWEGGCRGTDVQCEVTISEGTVTLVKAWFSGPSPTGPACSNFNATPNRLVIPPQGTSTLEWQCNKVISCTLQAQSGTAGTGGTLPLPLRAGDPCNTDTRSSCTFSINISNGSVKVSPQVTTTYRINCTGDGNVAATWSGPGADDSDGDPHAKTTVRVYNTRLKEILPR